MPIQCEQIDIWTRNSIRLAHKINIFNNDHLHVNETTIKTISYEIREKFVCLQIWGRFGENIWIPINFKIDSKFNLLSKKNSI